MRDLDPDRFAPAPWIEPEEVSRGYVYKVPRSWNVQPQEDLIVLTGNGLSIVTVIHVDAEPDIDIDASHDYKWAVQKVDLTEFRDLTEREKQFQDTMLHVERVKQRESLVQSFMDNFLSDMSQGLLFDDVEVHCAECKAEAVFPHQHDCSQYKKKGHVDLPEESEYDCALDDLVRSMKAFNKGGLIKFADLERIAKQLKEEEDINGEATPRR